MTMSAYELRFGLLERPFSLTPDPKYFVATRSHGAALEGLGSALLRREPFVAATGGPGVGKTLLCRTLVEQRRRRMPPASYIPSPLRTPATILQLILEDFGVLSPADPDAWEGADEAHLRSTLLDFLRRRSDRLALVVVDEAHTMPPAVAAEFVSLGAAGVAGRSPVQFVLVGQSAAGTSALPEEIDRRVSTRVRLAPLAPDECAAYVRRRLMIAGGAGAVTFSPGAIETLFRLSTGIPRIINLVCERALQEAAADGLDVIDAQTVERAATALELIRTRPRRFRWFKRTHPLADLVPSRAWLRA